MNAIVKDSCFLNDSFCCRDFKWNSLLRQCHSVLSAPLSTSSLHRKLSASFKTANWGRCETSFVWLLFGETRTDYGVIVLPVSPSPAGIVGVTHADLLHQHNETASGDLEETGVAHDKLLFTGSAFDL